MVQEGLLQIRDTTRILLILREVILLQQVLLQEELNLTLIIPAIHPEVPEHIQFPAEAVWKEVPLTLPDLITVIHLLQEAADLHLHIADLLRVADPILQDLHQVPQEVLQEVDLHQVLQVLLREDQDGDNLTQ